MLEMPRSPDLATPASLLLGWLAAAVALPFALLAAAVGQGLGAMMGGCEWIGLSLPIGRPVWALVNQPSLDFASRPTAFGYWFGSLLLPLAAAAAILVLLPSPRTLARGLTSIELSWAAAVTLGWLPLLDRTDGHLARWLALQDHPWWLLWAAPALATTVAAPITLRLLALARVSRPSLSRWRRLGLVTLYLVVPAAAWLGLAGAVAGAASLPALMGAAPPVAMALAIAFLFYPPSARSLRGPEGVSLTWLMTGALALAGLLWLAGRPLGGGRWAGTLWGPPGAFNNIRPWIAARPLPWTRPRVPGHAGNRPRGGGDSPVAGSSRGSAEQPESGGRLPHQPGGPLRKELEP